MLTFLIRSVTSQSNSYSIVLTRMGGPSPTFPRGSAGDRARDLMISSQTCWPLDQRGGPTTITTVTATDMHRSPFQINSCTYFEDSQVFIITAITNVTTTTLLLLRLLLPSVLILFLLLLLLTSIGFLPANLFYQIIVSLQILKILMGFLFPFLFI